MGIYPVLIYDISGLKPKFHWDGMKNGLSTYVKCVYKRMSNFEFSLYLSQFLSHRFSSNITGFLF